MRLLISVFMLKAGEILGHRSSRASLRIAGPGHVHPLKAFHLVLSCGEWACSGFFHKWGAWCPQSISACSRSHKVGWGGWRVGEQGSELRPPSGSFQSRFSHPDFESWPRLALNTCGALARASPSGHREELGWKRKPQTRRAGELGDCGLPPMDLLLDAHFDTFLWVICTITFWKSVLNPWFIFLSLFFIMVFTQRQEHAFKLTF